MAAAMAAAAAAAAARRTTTPLAHHSSLLNLRRLWIQRYNGRTLLSMDDSSRCQEMNVKFSSSSSSSSILLPSSPPLQKVGIRYHSSYEYPLRTETPTITRTLASSSAVPTPDNDNDDDDEMNNIISEKKEIASLLELRDKSRLHPNEIDRFDDGRTMTEEERSALRLEQKQVLTTNLETMERHQISSEPPSFLPKSILHSTSSSDNDNKNNNSSLEIPSTLITTLPNGIRVASQETYGQVCTVGILADCGSRHENYDQNELGANHLLELLSFQTSLSMDGQTKRTPQDIINAVDRMGGATFASSGREQTLYCIDVLRPNAGQAMELLSDTLLRPTLDTWEVEEKKRVIEYQHMDMPPEMKLGEGLQLAAYGPLSDDKHQQLGRFHFCPLEALPNLTADAIRSFRERNLLQPEGLVIAGAGVAHDELVELAHQYFGHIDNVAQTTTNPNEPPTMSSRTVPSTYTGGEYRLSTTNSIDGFTRVALAFELGGWHSDDLVPTCVLQTLLGGGNSFSAGGPGKGMYSRLYREVLNRYYWAESAEAFTAFHAESGLLGMTGSSAPGKSRDVVRVLAEHFWKLSTDFVTDEELDRARNMLKCNVLSQLESRIVLFEDIGRQILTYGQREDSTTMCEKIDAVTKEDIRSLVQKAMTKPPTVSTVGDDLSGVPKQEEIGNWFRH